MARRSIPLLVAGLLVTAGCVGTKAGPPPPPPAPARATQICGQAFTSADWYRLTYYNLGHANTGWVTADGFVPVDLKDGRTAWWMSDTMTGTANPDNSVSNKGNVHNSVVLQGGSCLTPQFGNPEMMPGSGGAWYWPGSSVVSGNTVTVFAYKVQPASGDPGFNWTVVGTAVARYDRSSLQLTSGPTPLPAPNAPAQYGGEAIPWGARSFLAGDGKVYLYGTSKHPIPPFGAAAYAWVARAPLGQVSDVSKWEFFTNPLNPLDPAWSGNSAAVKPMTFIENHLPRDNGPISQLSVVPYGNGYLAGVFAADVFKDAQGGTPVYAWTAEKPEGPWTRFENIDGSPREVARFTPQTSNQFAYDARVAFLSGGADWTVVYSRNDPNPAAQQQNWTLYRGEFEAPTGLP